MPRSVKRTIVDASLALKIPAQPFGGDIKPIPHDIIFEGWLLKKRRKKMQGYARRYFILRSSGLLSYSFEPGTAIRDQILLSHAAISSTPGRRDIHIDSETATFHIKCLTRQDFDQWMSTFRNFIATGPERILSRKSSVARVANLAHTVHKANTLLDEMGITIENIAETFSTLELDGPKKRKDRSLKTKDRDHKESGSVFSIFKKGRPPSPSGNYDDTSTSKDALPSSSDRIHALLETLLEQHDALKNSMLNLSSIHPSSSSRASPLPSIADEGGATPTKSTSHTTWHSGSLPRTSISSRTETGSIWYDASEGDEGAQEFVLEPEEMGDEETTPVKSDSGSTVDQTGESEIGEDSESSMTGQEPEELETSVSRRTQLPARCNGEEGSLFAVLKKSVGQDLSNISFPVTFNEPLTLLQRSAEELEYHDLLDKAAATSDWVERMCYVAAFAVSGYACTKHRSGRKGFTPMLGETFEDVRTKFIAEKVVHKPLLMAYHAEGLGWELNATSAGKTKFWGKSLEIIPTGSNHVKIGTDNFRWGKPSSFTRNLMLGTKYLEHCGEMVIENESSGARCVLDFKETGYWASSPNVVSGQVVSPDGKTITSLEGKWDEQFFQKLDSNHLHVLWRIAPFPRDTSDYYGYTYFGITLNEITADIKNMLPPTDSRLRPDVRALEEGDVPRAESEKARLEGMQRQRRELGQEPKPRWFKQVAGSDEWVYTGGYWEGRSQGWKNTEHMELW